MIAGMKHEQFLDRGAGLAPVLASDQPFNDMKRLTVGTIPATVAFCLCLGPSGCVVGLFHASLAYWAGRWCRGRAAPGDGASGSWHDPWQHAVNCVHCTHELGHLLEMVKSHE